MSHQYRRQAMISIDHQPRLRHCHFHCQDQRLLSRICTYCQSRFSCMCFLLCKSPKKCTLGTLWIQLKRDQPRILCTRCFFALLHLQTNQNYINCLKCRLLESIGQDRSHPLSMWTGSCRWTFLLLSRHSAHCKRQSHLQRWHSYRRKCSWQRWFYLSWSTIFCSLSVICLSLPIFLTTSQHLAWSRSPRSSEALAMSDCPSL